MVAEQGFSTRQDDVKSGLTAGYAGMRGRTGDRQGGMLSQWMRGIGLGVVAWVLVVLAGCGVVKPADFTIPSLVANGPIQVGEYALLTVPSGLPDAPVASKTTVTFQIPPAGGTSTALIVVPVTSVDAASGGTYVLHLVVPKLAITKATSYQLTVIGSTSKNTFASKAALLAYVLPGATLASINPTSGTVGQTLDVTLNGVSTKFVQGTTQASFGAGISVNGAAPGASGLIQVTNATTAVAHLVIGAGATPGTRDVVVATTPEQVTLAGAFAVKAVVLPPVPSAGGPYTGTSGIAVSFSAAGSSDPGGFGLAYAWTFGDGGTATGIAPTHTYAAPGNFAVNVTVSNAAGGSAVASTTALIAAPAQPPVANTGGPYSGTTGTAIAFSAAGSSDPQSSPLSYAWTFGDGTTGTGISPTHTYATANIYTVGLTVTNGLGLNATASTQAVVTAAKLPPVSKVGGPYSGKIGTALAFDGSGSSDPKSEALTYAWSFGDGSVGVGVSPSHTYATTGTYTVSLTVMNTDALSSIPSATTATITAYVPAGKVGGPYSGVAGTPVTFDGSGSTDLNGLALTYLWSFGDGGTGSGVAPAHTYAASGTYTVTLTVSDSQGAGTPVSTSAVIGAAAVAPVGRVGGPYSGVAGTAAMFDGSASTDGNGLALTYLWSFGDGSTGSGVTPTHTYAASGTYTVTLTVSDSKLSGTPSSTNAVISAVPVAPVGNSGGPYTGTAGTLVNFNGAGSTDGNGLALTYLWNFGDGSTGSGVAPTHVYNAAGTFTLTLTVSDGKLSGTPVTTSVVIAAAAVAPVGNAGGPYSGVVGTAVTFNGAGSTDGNSLPLTYLWNFGDGSTGSGVSPSHTYAASGTFTVTLTVSDNKLTGTPVTTSAVIVAAPVAPIGNTGGPYTGLAGTAVTFNGSGSTDGNGLALTYVWSFGDGATGSGVAPTHTYVSSGTYTVTLTVSDTNLSGAPVTTSAVIAAVAAQPPMASPGGPYSGTAGTAVSFSGVSSTDGNGLALTYLWNFGDGATGSGVAPTHTYATAGTFTVTLTVSDSKLSGTPVTTSAVITAAAVAPVGSAGGPYGGVAGTAVSFSGAGSTDGNGLALTYLWNFGDGATGSGVAPTHTYAAAGTFTVTLTVSDSKLSGAPVTASAVITAAAVAPVGSAGGPYSGVAGTAVSFSGAGSTDGNGLALTYLWNFGDGSSGSGVAPTHTYAASGTYTVTLTVSDSKLSGAPVTTSAVIAAVSAQPPVANPGGPYSGTAGTAVTFSGAGSTDASGLALTYLWSFGDGGTGSGVAPAHTYLAAGTYTVSLTVKDSGASSTTVTTSAVIAVAAVQAPVANAGGPYTGIASLTVGFDGTRSSDPPNPTAGPYVLSYAWSFGDGTTGIGPTPVHMYAAAGTYPVSLTVTKTGGSTGSATTTATISAGTPTPGSPTAVPGGPYNGTAGTSLAFSGSASTDPNGLALTYTWDFGDATASSGASVSHTYPGAGTYSVTLTVSNGHGFSTVGTIAKIAPGAALPAMVASAGGPYSVAVNQPLTVDGSKTTNPTSRQLTYTWDFGDGGTGVGRLTSHTYTQSGQYTLVLSATDGVTGYASASTVVTVTGSATEAITATAGGPYAGLTGAAINLDASRSIDNLGNTLSYSWSFGDGGTGTGATPSHAYAAKGTYTATVTVTSGAVSSMASATVAVTTPIQVAITSPIANALFGSNTVTVTGTVSAPNLTVAVNGTTAQVSGTSFSATGVTLREGVNLLTATATDGSGSIGTSVVSVLLDATAPTASIVTPANGSTVTSSSLTVAGLVNDSVTGTVGSDQVTVTVNGLPAQVSNRSFMASNIILVPGINTITVVTTDMVGNSSTTTAKVNLASVAAQQTLVMLSGNGQTGGVASFLPQPLVVQLQTSGGAPIVSRPVTFTVTRSDGQVEVAPTVAQRLTVSTDSVGKATVLFKLGSRSGLGINQVSATTPGAVGAVVFSATSTASAPTQMHAVRGENQRGVLGAPLASGLQVIVADANGNPIPGVAVTYTVASGDGTLDGQTTTENVTTDSSGKAIAQLTLGQQEGNNNYAVTATFAGNTMAPILFKASGYAEGAVVNTRVSGVVLDNANTPIPNATIKLLGTQLVTVSDVDGQFLFHGAPVGTVTLTVDGSTSTRPETFPFLSFVLQSLPGQNNALTHPVYLPAIDVNGGQTVGGDDPVTLTVANVPGVAFTVAPHSVTFPDGSKVGKLTLSQVKSDMVPMEPVNGAGPSFIWTLQPAGARFSKPIQVTLPNLEGLAPGQVTEIYQFDHDLEQFVSVGTSHVSADGSVIVTDAGFGITKAGWGHASPPPPNNGCIATCISKECISITLQRGPGACGCDYKAKDGAKCGNHPSSPDSCYAAGFCVGTVCGGKYLGENHPCQDGKFCDENSTCQNGVCQGTPYKDIPIVGDNTYGVTFEQAFKSGIDPMLKFASGLHIPITVAAVPIIGGSFKEVCCEAKHQLNVPINEPSVGAQVDVTSPEIPIPGLSYNVPRIGGVSVFLQLEVVLSGTIKWKDDHCADELCARGILAADAYIKGALGVYVGTLEANAGIKGGIHGDITVGCHQATFTFGLTDVSAVGEVIFPNGSKVGVGQPLISATTLGSITSSLR